MFTEAILSRERTDFVVLAADGLPGEPVSLACSRVSAALATEKPSRLSLRTCYVHHGLKNFAFLLDEWHEAEKRPQDEQLERWITRCQRYAAADKECRGAWLAAWQDGTRFRGNPRHPLFDNIEKASSSGAVDLDLARGVGEAANLAPKGQTFQVTHSSAVVATVKSYPDRVQAVLYNRRDHEEKRLQMTMRPQKPGAFLGTAVDLAAKILEINDRVAQHRLIKRRLVGAPRGDVQRYVQSRRLQDFSAEVIGQMESRIRAAIDAFDVEFFPAAPAFLLALNAPAA